MANVVLPFCAFMLVEDDDGILKEQDLRPGEFARLFREELERADTESVSSKRPTAS